MLLNKVIKVGYYLKVYNSLGKKQQMNNIGRGEGNKANDNMSIWSYKLATAVIKRD